MQNSFLSSQAPKPPRASEAPEASQAPQARLHMGLKLVRSIRSHR
ncbi:MAG: hypothetical protein SWY16_01275 [Cyanobacteriota bacterium]|nr:hypothetical protein [Cyanobacteriota bacterium]